MHRDMRGSNHRSSHLQCHGSGGERHVDSTHKSTWAICWIIINSVVEIKKALPSNRRGYQPSRRNTTGCHCRQPHWQRLLRSNTGRKVTWGTIRKRIRTDHFESRPTIPLVCRQMVALWLAYFNFVFLFFCSFLYLKTLSLCSLVEWISKMNHHTRPSSMAPRVFELSKLNKESFKVMHLTYNWSIL